MQQPQPQQQRPVVDNAPAYGLPPGAPTAGFNNPPPVFATMPQPVAQQAIVSAAQQQFHQAAARGGPLQQPPFYRQPSGGIVQPQQLAQNGMALQGYSENPQITIPTGVFFDVRLTVFCTYVPIIHWYVL